MAKHYETLSKEEPGACEIVFISSDKDQKSFNEYRAEMPWAALDFRLRSIKNQLSKKFHVRGIPTLVLLDASTSKVLTTSGRALVSKYGKNFSRMALVPEAVKEIESGTAGKFGVVRIILVCAFGLVLLRFLGYL